MPAKVGVKHVDDGQGCRVQRERGDTRAGVDGRLLAQEANQQRCTHDDKDLSSGRQRSRQCSTANVAQVSMSYGSLVMGDA